MIERRLTLSKLDKIIGFNDIKMWLLSIVWYAIDETNGTFIYASVVFVIFYFSKFPFKIKFNRMKTTKCIIRRVYIGTNFVETRCFFLSFFLYFIDYHTLVNHKIIWPIPFAISAPILFINYCNGMACIKCTHIGNIRNAHAWPKIHLTSICQRHPRTKSKTIINLAQKKILCSYLADAIPVGHKPYQ